MNVVNGVVTRTGANRSSFRCQVRDPALESLKLDNDQRGHGIGYTI